MVAGSDDVDLVRTNCKMNRLAAIAATTEVNAMSFRPVLRVTDLVRSISDSSLIPSGVIS